MKAIVLVLVYLCSVAQARDLTLTQALSLAEEHSRSLKRAQSGLAGAEADVRALQAERFPTLSANGAASYISAVPSFDIALPIPGAPSFSRELGSEQNYQLDLRLSMPLYTGGRISNSIATSKAARELSQAQLDAERMRLAFQTRVAYYTLYKADGLVRTSEAQLKRAEVISQDVQSLFDGGSADSVDILDAQLALSRAQIGLEQARNSRRTAELSLLTLLGLPISDSVRFAEVIPDPIEPDGDAIVDAQKPELRVAEAGVSVNRARVRLSKTDYLPTVSAYGGYSYGKPNRDLFNNSWNDYFTVGGNLTWSFNIGGRTANRARSANWALAGAEFDRDLIKENLTRDAAVSLEQMHLAHRQYLTAVAEYRITSDHFRLASAQHKEGTMTANRLLEAEADLAVADGSRHATLVQYYIARSAYLYAIGSTDIEKGN